MVRAVIRVPAVGEEGPRSASFGPSGLNMSKIPSLVFDMEDMVDQNDAQSKNQKSRSIEGMAEVVSRLRGLLEPWSEVEYMLLLHVRIAHEDAVKKKNCTPMNLEDLADTLRRLGYRVKLRTALGGGWGGACLRNLRHSFLTVCVENADGTVQSFIVDPRFKDQFQIAHSTERYAAVLAILDSEVVLPQDRLTKVVELLCNEMARSFQDCNATLPPWRQCSAMLSKWDPRRSEEVDLTYGRGPRNVTAAAAVNNSFGVAEDAQKASIASRIASAAFSRDRPPSPISEGFEIDELAGCSTETGSSVGEASDGEQSGHPMAHVFQGIQAAAAALPNRRNTWT